MIYQYLVEESSMARNTSITLGPHFDEFIATRVEKGRYGSVSEVVRAGLRLLEETESKLERLRRLLDVGEQSGIAEYSLESVIKNLTTKLTDASITAYGL
ncbi:type II toxin-antitoxin system ParD family antitoxin [Vreelandella venusta]|uniref:type II toxin-antitoxin system ParD family antitoxin n=1 Tax=Vreelandella venusta TaxID=44935 RepID=UPI00384D185E